MTVTELEDWKPTSLSKKLHKLHHRCFPVNFAKGLTTPFFRISENSRYGSFEKILFNKTSTYWSEFHLICDYVERILRFNIFVLYQPLNLFVNITIKSS